MRQTLFYIPHWVFDGPLLVGWLVVGLGVLVWLVRRNGWNAESLNFLPVYLVGAALIHFVVPGIEVGDVDPADPLGPPKIMGLAVRGYGVMMLLGLVVGVGLSMWRGKREGVDPEKLLTLAFWLVITGIVGARLFYVIQKADEFSDLSWSEALVKSLNVTEGGLVVYGSLIGAMLGGWFYLWWARLPILKIADIAAPGMAAGLALGRIGCLMNGCCFGGTCDLPAIAQTFPAGAAPYMRQLQSGELLGIGIDAARAADGSLTESASGGWLVAESVRPGSLADESGIRPGDEFRVSWPTMPLPVDRYFRAEAEGTVTGLSISLRRKDAPTALVSISSFPHRSLAVYPTQILASLNAALLCALLWFYYPFRRYRGRVFAMMLVLYAITRFLLEIIRRDELGQFGTAYTISQWISFGMLAGGLVLFFGVRQRV